MHHLKSLMEQHNCLSGFLDIAQENGYFSRFSFQRLAYTAKPCDLCIVIRKLIG